MEVDDEDSFVVPAELEGWDPMDLAPKPGETAYQAARRMELKGRRHTNYVAKWGDPDSLTAIMNRASNRNTTVEFMSSPVPGAASTAPPTAEPWAVRLIRIQLRRPRCTMTQVAQDSTPEGIAFR